MWIMAGVFIISFLGFLLGMVIGGPVNFRNFGDNGFAISGSAAVCGVLIVLVTAGGAVTWIGAILASLLCGIFARGAS